MYHTIQHWDIAGFLKSILSSSGMDVELFQFTEFPSDTKTHYIVHIHYIVRCKSSVNQYKISIFPTNLQCLHPIYHFQIRIIITIYFYLSLFRSIFRHICAMQQQTPKNIQTIPTFLCICCDYTVAFGLYSSGLVLWLFIHYPQYFVCGLLIPVVVCCADTLYSYTRHQFCDCIPKIYIYFCIKPEPSTEIIGAPDLYIETGSTINLTCVIENSPEPPAYIFWNHNNAVSTFTFLFLFICCTTMHSASCILIK